MATDESDADDLDHPLFSRLYRAIGPIDRRVFGPHRRELVRGLSGRVVDLGAGDGAMFPSVAAEAAVVADASATDAARSIEYHAVEPDRIMRRRARSRASELAVPVTIHDARAESLPFADDSVDAVIASLVFCTIADPDAALSEVARILRPDGEVRFLEHVGGDGYYRALQEAVTPAWQRVAGGCHLDRDTVDRFAADDRFETVAVVRTGVRTYPAAPVVRGVLRRRDDAADA